MSQNYQFPAGLRGLWQRVNPLTDLQRKMRIALLMVDMTRDRAEAAEIQLGICRHMLAEAHAEVAELRAANARLGTQLFMADSRHRCAVSPRRCYERDVLVDAGNGEYCNG